MIKLVAAYPCIKYIFVIMLQSPLVSLLSLFHVLLLTLSLSVRAELLSAEPTPVEIAPQLIRIPYPEIDNPANVEFYYQQALRLALDKTRVSDGDYKLLYSEEIYSVERVKQLIVDGGSVDLMWASHTAEREAFMRSISVDLLQGLNNYRVLLVNPQDQEKFSTTHTLDEFRQFTAGGGSGWTSSEILRVNNIKVVGAPQYNSLFKMLVAKRFDYISRGLHDVYGDFSYLHTNGFILETQENIILRYETPIIYCFFVNKNNAALADRIYRGMSIAEADGSFDALRLASPMFVVAQRELQKKRREIVLKVPIAVE